MQRILLSITTHEYYKSIVDGSMNMMLFAFEFHQEDIQ